MALAVPGRARHELLAGQHTRRLIRRRHAVDIGPERDYGAATAPARDPRRWHPGDAALDGEAVALEQRGQIALRLELLVADLTEAEQAVHDLLRQLAPLFDFGNRGALRRHERVGGDRATLSRAHELNQDRYECETVHALHDGVPRETTQVRDHTPDELRRLGCAIPCAAPAPRARR